MPYQYEIVIIEVKKAIAEYKIKYPEFQCSYITDKDADGLIDEALHKLTLSVIVDSAKLTITRNLYIDSTNINSSEARPETHTIQKVLDQLENLFVTLDTDYKRIASLVRTSSNCVYPEMQIL